MAKSKKLLQSPMLEIMIMVVTVAVSFIALFIIGAFEGEVAEGAMSVTSITWIQIAFFLLSLAIAFLGVIAGIGGGVIFTPVMLAFTTLDSVMIRGAGLVVAMFSGLISTGILIKKGMVNYRLCIVLTISQALGALFGSTAALALAEGAGAAGEGIMRAVLGLILAGLGVYFIKGGAKMANPVVNKVDKFTTSLKMDGTYYEESEGKMRTYKVKGAPLGLVLVLVVGFIGGFFGMGGGWAITPTLNMAMGIPLKLAAANSGTILGIGSCVSIWPYIFDGALIPLFILPWLAGQVVGGFIGSYVLAKIKVATVRLILIGIMFFTAYGLVFKGLNKLGVAPQIVDKLITNEAQIAMFVVIIGATIASIILQNAKAKKAAVPVEEKAEETVAEVAATEEKKEVIVPIAPSERIYANIIHWVTIASCVLALIAPVIILLNPSNNILDPSAIFDMIFAGATPDEVWATATTGGFPGAHYYFSLFSSADSWAQIALNLGCSVGLWALIPASIRQLTKEKSPLYGILGLVLAALIVLAMIGVLA